MQIHYDYKDECLNLSGSQEVVIDQGRRKFEATLLLRS